MALRSCADFNWFEDYAVGDEFESAPVLLSQDEIIEYARKYDPQPIHLDPEAAARTHFGGIIAGGGQTVGIAFGSMIRAGFLNGRSMGSPGLDEVRWKRPVRPGDTLTTRARVVETRPSAKRSDRGYVSFIFEMHNQRGEIVLTMRVNQILPRKH